MTPLTIEWDANQPIWAPDGKTIAFSWGRDGSQSIFTRLADGSGEIERLIARDGPEVIRPMSWSPDGQFLVYSIRTGGGRWQISSDGGDSPAWSRDGGELFFLEGQNVMAVTVAASRAFRASAPRMLFDFPFVQTNSERQYDVAPDGRFVMIGAEASAVARREIYLATNWATELARLVP